ncbi:HNH endonuclease [Nocardioidaceae bacterium SCSIO 66511]|nr:HNH endonuclease [Nocardioidaceae bacterium SCSIO 66511]
MFIEPLCDTIGSMFEPQTYTRLRDVAGQAAGVSDQIGLATDEQLCQSLRDLQAALDLLDGVRASLFAQLKETEAHKSDGASTVAGWARQELRMGLGESRRHTKAGQTLKTLPKVADALRAGTIRAAHVDEFTVGVTKVGADIMTDLQDVLVPLARKCEPRDLRVAINELNDIVNCEERDKAYQRGMNKRDITATKCGDGYYVSGMLDPVTGAKFAQWAKTMSMPEYDGDDRAPSDRRVDGLGRMLDDQNTPPPADQQPSEQTADTEQSDSAGEQSGEQQEPSKPRRRADVSLLVLADLETLLRLPGARPATLVGFGPIGPQLLGYLTCDADTSGILTHGITGGPVPQANVLNVGRTSRLATTAQRKAITARQDGICANPGCGSSFLEFHHVNWWNRDRGRTDLSNMVGVCGGCHHLVHQNKLVIRHDGHGGFTFHRSTRTIIDDHARVTKQRVRDLIAKIRHAAETEAEQKPARSSPPPGRRRSLRDLPACSYTVTRLRYRDLTEPHHRNRHG